MYFILKLLAFFLFVFSDIEDDILSLKQFSTEVIVACAVRCIKTINGNVDLPNTLPQAMSAKFRMGTSLASNLTVMRYPLF